MLINRLSFLKPLYIEKVEHISEKEIDILLNDKKFLVWFMLLQVECHVILYECKRGSGFVRHIYEELGFLFIGLQKLLIHCSYFFTKADISYAASYMVTQCIVYKRG